jgi:flagellar hook-length control protein FliK
MLAKSELREAKGTQSAAAQAGSTKGRGKGEKTGGLIGLFSELLTQAQKGIVAKVGEGIAVKDIKTPLAAKQGAATKPSTADRPSALPVLRLATGDKPSKAAVPSSFASDADNPVSEHGLSPSSHTTPNTPRTRKAPEKRLPPSGNKDEEEAGEAMAKAVEAKRRAKIKPDLIVDGSSTLLLAHHGMMSSSALNAKAVDPRSSDADSSISIIDKRGRPSSEPKLSVLDLRRTTNTKQDTAVKVEPSIDAASKDTIHETKPSSDSGRELTRDLSLGTKGTGESGSAPSANRLESGVTSGRGQDFQSMLADRLREAWNGDIVQSARIVLRDGDSGTIRLRLKPESLGNVKIELNLSDNNISGRIVVESDEAKNAFERNMNQLADAFKQGGFDSARLDVSVGGGSTGGASGQGGQADGSAGPFFSERFRNAVGSSADPATAASAYARRGSAVDIFA